MESEDRIDKYWEEYEARWFDSYDDYYNDYVDRNRAELHEEYLERFWDEPQYKWNYDYDDFQEDFYDYHYWEYFDDDWR